MNPKLNLQNVSHLSVSQILLSDDEESCLPRSKEERKAMKRRMKELRKKLKVEKKKVIPCARRRHSP